MPLVGAPVFGISTPLQLRVLLDGFRRVAMRHHPQALTRLQIDGHDTPIGRLEERKAEHRRRRADGLAARCRDTGRPSSAIPPTTSARNKRVLTRDIEHVVDRIDRAARPVDAAHRGRRRQRAHRAISRIRQRRRRIEAAETN